MMGLASVYRKYSLQGEGGREASKQISWIKDKLLHIYYQNSIDDRFEKLFFTLFPLVLLLYCPNCCFIQCLSKDSASSLKKFHYSRTTTQDKYR